MKELLVARLPLMVSDYSFKGHGFKRKVFASIFPRISLEMLAILVPSNIINLDAFKNVEDKIDCLEDEMVPWG